MAAIWPEYEKAKIIFRTLITSPILLKRNEQLPVKQLTLPRIKWIQMTAMKVVKSTRYRGMSFYCVISIVSQLFILQHKNCDFHTFAKNDK